MVDQTFILLFVCWFILNWICLNYYDYANDGITIKSAIFNVIFSIFTSVLFPFGIVAVVVAFIIFLSENKVVNKVILRKNTG